MRGDDEAGSARLPGRGDAGRAELGGTAAGQPGDVRRDVLRATTPVPPGTGGTGAKKRGGETG